MDAETTKAQPAVKGDAPSKHGATDKAASNTQQPSIAEHPRAARHVREARQAAGLIGFLLAGWLSMSTNTLAGTLLRALVAGFVCQVIVWAAAIVLLRHLILAELRSREQALMQAAAARLQARERAGGAAGINARVQGGARS
jgi:hypothetical protein